ncbi:hypothetical protein PVAP13_9NG262873 [Panicum virgatum]|uniref:Uncharacterized protein n=1 Tax=Panicum virgatum TaxID=38727 RepID=A0A8T0MRE4_PANVG|nr:hypothetical protein PVAP13_9NG262873 [Panicum virgatum]
MKSDCRTSSFSYTVTVTEKLRLQHKHTNSKLICL